MFWINVLRIRHDIISSIQNIDDIETIREIILFYTCVYNCER